MNVSTIAFYLIIFVMFMMFVTFIIHHTLLLYYPSIIYYKNYPEAIYPVTKFLFLSYLPKKFNCYFDNVSLNISFCINTTNESFADVCFFSSVKNVTCKINVYNLTTKNINSFINSDIDLGDISSLVNSKAYFGIRGGYIFILLNFSSLNSYDLNKLFNILFSYYERTYTITVPQYNYYSENISKLLKRLYLDVFNLLDTKVCIKYLKPKNNFKIIINFSDFSCNETYLKAVIENSKTYVKRIFSYSADTFIHEYLVPEKEYEKLSLPVQIQGFLIDNLSVCGKINSIHSYYIYHYTGDCRSSNWWFYISFKPTTESLINVSYTLLSFNNSYLLEINYTIPVVDINVGL